MESMKIIIFQKSAEFLIWNTLAGYMHQLMSVKLWHIFNLIYLGKHTMYNMS